MNDANNFYSSFYKIINKNISIRMAIHKIARMFRNKEVIHHENLQ